MMQPSMNPKTAFTNTCMETKDTISVVEKGEQCFTLILQRSFKQSWSGYPPQPLGYLTVGRARLENNRASSFFLLSNAILSLPEVNALFMRADHQRNSNVRISALEKKFTTKYVI